MIRAFVGFPGHGMTLFALPASPACGLVQSRAVGQFFAALHREKVTCRAQPSPLTLHEQKKPLLWSVGKAFLPALLSRRWQDWDDKGKALGVAIRIVTRRAKTNSFTVWLGCEAIEPGPKGSPN